MKFTCDRCGKRFASVDDPRPGRVYRVRCRCGNVVVVKAPPGAVPDPAPRARRSAKAAREDARHVPASRPRPPPLPVSKAAPGAEPSPPVIELDPLPTPSAGAGETPPARAPASEPTPTLEPIGEPTPPPEQAAPGAVVTPTPAARAEDAPAPEAPHSEAPHSEVPHSGASAPEASAPTPPIVDDPFLRAAREEAAGGAASPTPAEALALELRPQDDGEETPVELSRSESFDVRGPPTRTIAAIAAALVGAAIAFVLALRC